MAPRERWLRRAPTGRADAAASSRLGHGPFRAHLSTTVGFGADAGHATVTARVLNVRAAALADVPVQFATDVGTLSATSVVTAADGIAATVVTAAGTAHVTASAGALTTRTLVASEPVSTIPPAPPSEPPPTPPVVTNPPPSSTPQPPTQGPLGVTLTIANPTTTLGSATVMSALVTNGPAQRFDWTFADGATFTGLSSTGAHTFGAVGSYIVTLTVVDLQGRSASATATATVVPAPPPPPPSYSVFLAAAPPSVTLGGVPRR